MGPHMNHGPTFQFAQSSRTILHSQQQWVTVPVAPHPHQHLVVSEFWVGAVLMGVKRYLIVVLIRLSLTTYDVEHVFMCLLAISVSSLVRCLRGSLAHFFKWVIGFLIVESEEFFICFG